MLNGVRPELQGIVDEAARLLGAPITLEDRAFDLIAYGSQRADVDFVRQGSIMQRGSDPDVRQWFESFGIARAAGPVLIPAEPGRGIAARLCLPARWRGVTYGYVWAYDWVGDVSAAPVAAAMELADHAGTLLAAQSRTREAAASTLGDLLSGDADDVTRAVGVVRDRMELRAHTPVVVVVAGTVEPTEDLSLNLWRLPRAALAASSTNGTTLLVPLTGHGRDGGAVSPRGRPRISAASPLGEPGTRAHDLAPARVAAGQLIDLYAERVPDHERSGLIAGIGAPTTDLRLVRSSWRQARLAMQVAGVDPARRPVATWDELGPYRLLAADIPPSLVLDPAVAAILTEPELARTARVFLDRAGNVAATAAELGVHRQTLYHRLRRIETLTGRSFARGEDRLELHLGLLLAPLL